MSALTIIGWGFIGGLAVCAFILPIYLLDALFKKKDPPPDA